MTAPHDPAVLEADAIARFSDEDRRAVYEAIELRRDVRHFDPAGEVDEDTLLRILAAAHAAPSVGFSQPWRFVVVRSRATRERVRASFLRVREAEAARFPPARREEYLRYRLEGVLEASLNVCVVADLRDRGEAILGTTTQPESLRASCVCAVQNLWLAARVEGLGVGWVSIVEPAVLRAELGLPDGVEPVAYLCVGKPVAYRRRPMLEESAWEPRRALDAVVFAERFVDDAPPATVERSFSVAEASFSSEAADAARAAQARLAKPPGSLGRLEDLAVWYAGCRGRFPVAAPRRSELLVFAADHGVTAQGVSAYPSSVTPAVVAAVMAGGAAVNVLAREHGVAIRLVDVGVAGDLSLAPREPVVPLVTRRLRAGTHDMTLGPAMTPAEWDAALGVGADTANAAIDAGAELLGIGEIGIGNTTAAAALICKITGAPAAEIVGRGAGLDDAGVARKIAVVERALARHREVSALGGFEIAAMAGALLAAAARGVPTILDGYVTNAAALVAQSIAPASIAFVQASHRSAERGASAALAALGLAPLLDLSLRLGEGTGAILAMALVRSAVAVQSEMASFASLSRFTRG